jgi:hypothetical protein
LDDTTVKGSKWQYKNVDETTPEIQEQIELSETLGENLSK